MWTHCVQPLWGSQRYGLEGQAALTKNWNGAELSSASAMPTGWTLRCSCCGLHASAHRDAGEAEWDSSTPSLPANRWVIRTEARVRCCTSPETRTGGNGLALQKALPAPEKGYHVRKEPGLQGFLEGGVTGFILRQPSGLKRVMPLRRCPRPEPCLRHFRKTSLLEPADVCSAGVLFLQALFFVFYSTMIQTFPLMWEQMSTKSELRSRFLNYEPRSNTTCLWRWFSSVLFLLILKQFLKSSDFTQTLLRNDDGFWLDNKDGKEVYDQFHRAQVTCLSLLGPLFFWYFCFVFFSASRPKASIDWDLQQFKSVATG